MPRHAPRRRAGARPAARPRAGEELARIDELAALGGLRSAVAAALAELAAEQRDAVRLRVVEELDYAEVAGRLGISEQAPRARVSRGLRAIASALDGFAPVFSLPNRMTARARALRAKAQASARRLRALRGASPRRPSRSRPPARPRARRRPARLPGTLIPPPSLLPFGPCTGGSVTSLIPPGALYGGQPIPMAVRAARPRAPGTPTTTTVPAPARRRRRARPRGRGEGPERDVQPQRH